MKRNSSSYPPRNKDCFLYPALPVSHRKVFVSPELFLTKVLGIQVAIRKIDSQEEALFMRRIYEIHCDAMSEYEVQSFINTKAFQAWLHDKNSILTVGITRPWDSLRAYKEWCSASWSTAALGTSHQSRSLSCPIAACIAKYVQNNSVCDIAYVDCAWVLSRQQQIMRTVVRDVLKREQGPGQCEDSLVDPIQVLQSLFLQIFSHCPQRDELLQIYATRLRDCDFPAFQSEILNTGLPPNGDLLPILEHIMGSLSSKTVMISLDHLEHIKKSGLAVLVKSLDSLRRDKGGQVSILLGGLCLQTSGDNLLTSFPSIRADTEYQGMISSYASDSSSKYHLT